jgi:hypothetical protein
MVNGAPRAVPVFGEGAGINSLHDAAQYVASKYALTRLMNSRAATQSSLMPGALSAFGYRKFKGLVAEWMTTRSAERALLAQDSVVSAAKADPGLAEKLINEGTLTRLSAQADDAVNAHDGTVLAHKPLVNLQDGVKATLDDLNRKLSNIDAFGAGDAAQAQSLGSELDIRPPSWQASRSTVRRSTSRQPLPIRPVSSRSRRPVRARLPATFARPATRSARGVSAGLRLPPLLPAGVCRRSA